MSFASSTWNEVIEAWSRDPEARAGFNRRLANLPFEAFAWETRPVSAATLDRPYEDVIHPSEGLARVQPDADAFAEHFSGTEPSVSTFVNLGGDAVLVAPSPGPQELAYPHLAAFARTAPAAQIDALWIAVAEALRRRLAESPDPVWVSTAGLGVHWLHVRLDQRPKYYRHEPFRIFR